MKILYFHQHFSTPSGSTGTRSYEMSKALVQAGHDVTIVCGTYSGGVTGLNGQFHKGKREGMVNGIRIIELQLSYSNYQGFFQRSLIFLKFALLSIGIALREPCDLVFATTTPLTAGLPGICARWLRRKRFVFEVRDLWPELPKAMGVIRNPVVLGCMSWLEWLSYRSAHACIGLSPGIVEGIRRRSKSDQRVSMIPNGCDLSFFSQSNINEIRPEGVCRSDLMAVFTGAHGMANGLDTVIGAAEVLQHRARKDIKLVFIGDGKLKPALCAQVAEKKLKNCIFIDPVSKNELVGYLKSADIGLMILANIPAFYYGTSPNKFFDYLAIGLPVLNNYPGWLANMIKEKRCGYAVEPDNPELFADALEDAADHFEKLRNMGENALLLGQREFDRKILAAEFVAWLEQAAA